MNDDADDDVESAWTDLCWLVGCLVRRKENEFGSSFLFFFVIETHHVSFV